MKVVGLVFNSTVPSQTYGRLFDWLSGVFSVRFQERPPGGLEGLDAAVFWGFTDVSPGLPSLHIPAPVKTNTSGVAAMVQFAQTTAVPGVFRRRAIGQENLVPESSLNLKRGDQIIATLQEKPLWAVREEGGCRADLSAMALPVPDEASVLFNYFAPCNFLRLLPLVDFLRRVTDESQWSSPGLRACFMFDDPNLHSTRYGWINFQDIVQDGSTHNYHTSMATVPLDAWFESKKAVALFANNPARISLLVHGNEHIKNELASFSSHQQRLGSLAQALKRISRLEAKTSIEVSRVMAAPHGACSEDTLRVMAQMGFEAACISVGSLRAHNVGKPWVQKIGLRMSEIIAGLPVIPRFRISRECQNAILLAAYLDQPIVPVGHHQDVAGGLGLLSDLAAFINSIGEVRWMDMKGMARSNYRTRTEGNRLRVQTYSRLFNLKIPSGVTQLSVERPSLVAGTAEGLRIRTQGQADQLFPTYNVETVSVQPGASVEITSLLPGQINPDSVRLPGIRPWNLARRQLCECRDRLSPLVAR